MCTARLPRFSPLSWAFRKPSPSPFSVRFPKITRHCQAAFHLPESFDWRKQGPVTHDGSWAFASTGAIEALLKIHTGILVELSPQQLLDCADTCFECGGGNAAAAFEYVMANGICTEKDYPWVGYKRKCQTKNKPLFHIDGYSRVSSCDEYELRKAVARQPVAASVWSGSFKDYTGGIWIYKDMREETDIEKLPDTDHDVLIVGYGTDENGVDYWIVKNSWGPSWGMDGYMHILRDTKRKHFHGDFGIQMYPIYPTIDSDSELKRI